MAVKTSIIAGALIAFKQLKHVFGINVPQGSSFYEIISYIIVHIEENYSFRLKKYCIILRT